MLDIYYISCNNKFEQKAQYFFKGVNIMKRTKLSILTSVFMMLIISACVFSSSAAFEFKEDKNTKIIDSVVYQKYNADGKTFYSVIQLAPSEKKAKEITQTNILSEIDGHPVTHISMQFWSYPKIKEIKIPETVTYLSLNGLTNLRTVVIPESVTELAPSAFAKCKKLKTITLPQGITAIPQDAFSQCTNLEEVITKGKISSIGSMAFYRCENLKTFDTSNAVTIEKGAFSWCSSLDGIKLNEKLTVIEEEVFNRCEKLSSIDFSKFTSIGSMAFYNCKSIEQVNFSAELEYIGCSAFSGTGIETVTIPSKTYVGCNNNDHNCDGGHFKDCKNLKEVIFEEKEGRFNVPTSAFSGCTALEKVILPSGTKGIIIGDRAFKSCKKLKRIVNLKDVYWIREAGFAYCTSLKRIKGIGDLIEDKAFIGCKSLKTVTLDGTKTTSVKAYKNTGKIGRKAFENCTALETITLPDRNIKIEARAFKNCTKLRKVYNSEKISSIGTSAFAYCKSLKEITLSSKVKTVGEKAFLGCTKLGRVVIQGSKKAPAFSAKSFSSTDDRIKFITKNSAVAKSVKANLKNSGAKNARVYIKTSTTTKRV